jgi:ribonuclease P protein component
MQKKHRLRDSASFQTIRREGRVVLHPFLVLAVLPNGLPWSRFGFSVGRRIGKAAERNRIKRWMREAVRLRIRRGEIEAGWDVVLVARNPMREASYHLVDDAIKSALRRAGLVNEAP